MGLAGIALELQLIVRFAMIDYGLKDVALADMHRTSLTLAGQP